MNNDKYLYLITPYIGPLLIRYWIDDPISRTESGLNLRCLCERRGDNIQPRAHATS